MKSLFISKYLSIFKVTVMQITQQQIYDRFKTNNDS